MRFNVIHNTIVFFEGAGENQLQWAITRRHRKPHAQHVTMTLESTGEVAKATGVSIRDAAIIALRHELGHKKVGITPFEFFAIYEGYISRRDLIDYETRAWEAGLKLRLPKHMAVKPEVYAKVASYCLATYENLPIRSQAL